ncbi:MAG: methylmalonyl-CoA epimerase [Propionibacteriaceae bacterium]
MHDQHPDHQHPDLQHLGLADLVLGVDHVGIAVGDLEAALDWWTTTVGLVVLHREENPDQQVVEVMLAIPDDQPERATPTQLQLLSPLSDDSAIARFLQRRGPGLQHIAFTVSDIEIATARLVARGGRLLYPEARTGTALSKINFIHPRDTGGVLVELVQPCANSEMRCPD